MLNNLLKIYGLIFTLFLFGCNGQNHKQIQWNETIKQVSSGVVSIQTDVPVSFDGKWNTSGYATGFIVDAQQGIILTNRHVVTPGPVTAKAILINNEEIDLVPLYIDPVHDFGFFSYKPEDIKHLKPHEFELDPNSAHVGQEIRIIGNDAGQKVSILDGTISRLDREAPNYGSGRYNDFNTFYIQASTASTGGSSGSPVINIHGKVVALNAGSKTRSANAFYLPLNSVVSSLKQLQAGQEIHRGSLLTTFISKPYAELQRLGLTPELEQQYRQQYPDLKGLLTVQDILPGSSADNVLAIGDIILTINQQNTVEFQHLEQIFNQNIEQNIDISLLRAGKLLDVTVTVSDLQDVTPKSYLKFDASVFHDLSYQQARHLDQPAQGVYVAVASSAFKSAGIPNHAVLTELNGEPLINLTQFVEITEKLQQGENVHIRYYSKAAPKMSKYALLEVNRMWFEHSFCQLDRQLGYWPCQETTTSKQMTKAVKNQVPSPLLRAQHTGMEDALVKVKYFQPYSILGRAGDSLSVGTGLIVDKEKGWVVIDRAVVNSVLGSVKIIINNQLEVAGQVEYIHPLHNLAVVSYPPEAIGDLPVANAKFASEKLQGQETLLQMGLNYDGEVEYRSSPIDTIQELWLNAFSVPQFSESNLNVVHLVNPNSNIDGILLNNQGEIAALWATFAQGGEDGKGTQYLAAGITSDYVQEVVELAKTQQNIHSLNINLTQLAPVKALQRGLPKQWLDKIIAGDSVHNKLLMIYQIMADSPSAQTFKRGDILLTINDQPVFSFKEFERLSQAAELTVKYFREGQVLEQTLLTSELSGRDINSVLFWSGLSLHEPHRAARMQRNIGDEGLYIASYNYGSPATRYNVYAMRRIVEVDGVPIKTSQDFIQLVQNKMHGESVLLKTKDFNNSEDLVSLKVDNHYWPSFEIRYEQAKWQKRLH